MGKIHPQEKVIKRLSETGKTFCTKRNGKMHKTVQAIHRNFLKRGLIIAVEQNDEVILFKASDIFYEWLKQYKSGITRRLPVKWQKENHSLNKGE